MSHDASNSHWLVEQCLARALDWEPHLQAWVSSLDNPPAMAQPKTPIDGAIAGVGFAVKDIIDVAGYPTRCGSLAFQDAAPAAGSAPVVAALNDAGGIGLGKTTSTEFAFIDPTQTRNPFDVRCTPGGSSSGTGAVVGAHVVPFGLGTQTAGSLCRPAAYCGAYAYKASLGWWPMQGITPFARSFDMVGPIAVSMPWLLTVHDIWAQAFERPLLAEGADLTERPLVIGVARSPDQSPSEPVANAIADAAARFKAAGHQVRSFTPEVSFKQIIAAHRQIMLAEAAQDLLPLIGDKRALLGPRLAEGLQLGETITQDEVDRQTHWLEQAAESFWRRVEGIDVILAPPVGSVAPLGLTTTGDQTYLTPWTSLGGPLVSMPHGLDEEGMPLSVMLASRPGSDASLLVAANRLDDLLQSVAPPRLPA
ncbi:MAG: amidase [Burkholderiaceae bacterium]